MAISGAPTTTPSAYAEITWPACGIPTWTPCAISGSRPIVTNSVVPSVNPPTAIARIASATARGLRMTSGRPRSRRGVSRAWAVVVTAVPRVLVGVGGALGARQGGALRGATGAPSSREPWTGRCSYRDKEGYRPRVSSPTTTLLDSGPAEPEDSRKAPPDPGHRPTRRLRGRQDEHLPA